jgi:acyl-CoA thioesterase-2
MRFEDLFRLAPGPSDRTWTVTPSPLLLTPRRTLQGGAGLGAALLAAETLTGRPPIWASAQFLSFAAGVEPIDVQVALEVEGHNTTQARAVVSRAGHEIVTVLAALGSRSFQPEGLWVDHPAVPAPDRCEPYDFFVTGRNDLADLLELRLAVGRQARDVDGTPGGDRMTFWCRVRRPAGTDGVHVPSCAELAFIGDVFPLSFNEPIGGRYSGSTIDNTIRYGPRVATEWILLDCRPEQVANGFGYGQAHLWAEDGTLLATASQTTVMRMEDDSGDSFTRSTRRIV